MIEKNRQATVGYLFALLQEQKKKDKRKTENRGCCFLASRDIFEKPSAEEGKLKSESWIRRRRIEAERKLLFRATAFIDQDCSRRPVWRTGPWPSAQMQLLQIEGSAYAHWRKHFRKKHDKQDKQKSCFLKFLCLCMIAFCGSEVTRDPRPKQRAAETVPSCRTSGAKSRMTKAEPELQEMMRRRGKKLGTYPLASQAPLSPAAT